MEDAKPTLEAGSPRRSRRRTGSVILLVLMTLLLTAFALTKYLEKASIDLMADARDASADRLRVHAYSALETVLAVLQEFQTADSGLHSPAEGWGTPLDFAGYTPPDGLTVETTLEDESAKIPLTHADFPTLRDLFMLLGQKQSDAEQLADAMLVWIQQGYEPVNSFSVRATDYKRAAIPHDPPARSLHSFAELASIQLVRDRLFDENGRPNDLWRSFVDSVSLFDFSQPNTNTAKMTTLAAFGGYDEGSMKLISDYVGGLGSYSRQGPAYFQNTQEVNGLVGSASSTRMGIQVRCLRINVTVLEGQTSFRVSAVVTAPGGAQLPPPDQLTAADTATSSAAANDSTAAQNNSTTADATAADAGTTTSSTAGQTPSTLNYPFTLMEIRENDEIVESVSSSQSAQP